MADTSQLLTQLDPDEQVLSVTQIDGYHAEGVRSITAQKGAVALTQRRYVLFSLRGALKKRYELEASWPLDGFTDRINSSEGTALGPFLRFLTLFLPDGSTVSACFRVDHEREVFKGRIIEAITAADHT